MSEFRSPRAADSPSLCPRAQGDQLAGTRGPVLLPAPDGAGAFQGCREIHPGPRGESSHGCSGDERDRTANPGLAKPVLSQLSYVPRFFSHRYGQGTRCGRHRRLAAKDETSRLAQPVRRAAKRRRRSRGPESTGPQSGSQRDGQPPGRASAGGSIPRIIHEQSAARAQLASWAPSGFATRPRRIS